MIIPCIDLRNGHYVKLMQGRTQVMENENVIETVGNYNRFGQVQIIDLDAAFNTGNNRSLIKELCQNYDCRIGGGIRTIELAEEILSYGANKIIIGTAATEEFLSKLQKDMIIVAIDAKDGVVVDHGWKQSTKETPVERIMRLGPYCSEFLYTDVNRDGSQQGIDYSTIELLQNSTKNKLNIAGGIGSVEDIVRLEEMGCNPQLGNALYTGKILLPHAFISVLDFNKRDGFIPTIVQDVNGVVLMLAYSNQRSLQNSFQTGLATYYSTSRQELWVKGETSGNTQQLVKARYDCDRDALLFTVKQQGVACHTGKYSCFD